MADAAKRARLAQNRSVARGEEPTPQPQGDDYDDVSVQAKILDPEPGIVSIGGQEIRLYPLSAKDARRFTGLVAQVFGDAAGEGSATARIGGVLAERYSERFLPYVARATSEKPGAISSEQESKLAREFDERASFADLARCFRVMLELNHVIEEITGAKN